MNSIIKHKLSLLLVASCAVSSCSNAGSDSEKDEVDSKGENTQVKKIYAENSTGMKAVSESELGSKKLKKQSEFKFHLNGGYYFSKMEFLKEGAVVWGADMQEWRVNSDITVTFNRKTKLDENWNSWLKHNNGTSRSLDKINYSFKLASSNADLYKAYNWAMSQPNVESVELSLKIVSKSKVSSY